MPPVPVRKPISIGKVPEKRVVPVPTSSQGPSVETGYEERLIHVIRMDSGTSTIKAKCIGTLAVHKGLIQEGGWSVTHIPIQLSMVNVSSEQDALRLGKYLWLNLRKVVEQSDIRKITQDMPKWVALWCRAMREQRQWLGPKSFKEVK